MNHHDVTTRLSALIDNALPADEAAHVAEHLADCESCRQAHAAMLSMQSWLKRDATQALPPGLADTLSASLDEPAQPLVLTARKPEPVRKPFWFWPGMTGVGGLVAGALLVALLLPQAPSSQAVLTQEVLAGHIRALQADHLADVISTDQHTVKPWFAGKLDFSPPVHDLVQAGFPLAGGRLDYLDNRPVAALVYRYKLHVINVYMWPATHAPTKPDLQTRQGYQIVHWQQEGMDCWAVSDLNGPELSHFSELLRAAA